MLRVTEIKMPVEYDRAALLKQCAALLSVSREMIEDMMLVKKSLDARKKPRLFYVLSVDVSLRGGKKQEDKILSRAAKDRGRSGRIARSPKPYRFPYSDARKATEKAGTKRPVIVGAGPAGMACAYYLSRAGLAPILIERGKPADERRRDVEDFWEKGVLSENSNVQFGEGGAGTFSDGKLNTLIKDKEGRCREILRLYVSMGAPEQILYDAKPHVGTDKLVDMCIRLREEIRRLGGEVLFETRMEKILTEGDRVCGIETVKTDGSNALETIETDTLVLAIGHSARDTFRALYEEGITMEAKPFAVGFRLIHDQHLIDVSQYGEQSDDVYEKLGAASYKLTAQSSGGRGVYSFCMCPGGYVVNASSEKGRLAVNGMSYSGRGSGFANSAIIVTVTPQDYPASPEPPLSGIAFQRELEEKVYKLAEGNIPVQLFSDYQKGESSRKEDPILQRLSEGIKGRFSASDLSSILPDNLKEAFLEGMQSFDSKIRGFAGEEALVLAVESRTSSPVRIPRGADGQAELKGLYPVGEGAGYAGGITSAAMDGLLAAERIAAALK